jgi:hypothetical protein
MIAPGRYRHYRDGVYCVLFIAGTHNHNGDIDVIYVSCTHGKPVTRPLKRDSRNEDSWLDTVTWPDEQMRHRFVPDEPELAALFEGP